VVDVLIPEYVLFLSYKHLPLHTFLLNQPLHSSYVLYLSWFVVYLLFLYSEAMV
jgi:hypothetical protein